MSIKLETERLVLRSLNISDTELLYDFLTRNAEFFKPWSPKYEQDYFDIEHHRNRLLKIETETETQIKFGFFIKDDLKKLIGTVSFSNIIKGPFLSCFLGYRTDEKANGKGYTTEAIKRGIEYVFSELKLHRIEANIMPSNIASVRVIEKLGFVMEGLSHNYLKINGKWEDHLRYVLLSKSLE